MRLLSSIRLLIFLSAVCACSQGCKSSLGKQACRMENETVLATTKGVPPAVAVKSVGPDRFLASWSTDEGTFVTDIGLTGIPIGSPRRIHKSVDSDLLHERSLAETPKTFWPRSERSSIHSEDLSIAAIGRDWAAVAMIERPLENAAGGAYVALVSSGSNTATKVIRIGEAGEYANQISAAMCEDSLLIAWHEGMLDSSSILIARIGLEPFTVKQTSRLKSANALSHPSLSSSGQCAFMAWSEIVHEGDKPRSLVKVASLSADLEVSKASEVAKGRFLDPAPQLAPAGDRVGIVFRDDADSDDTPEFYFTLLGPRGDVVFEPKRISQADGWRGPSLIYMKPNFVTAAIRSFQRNLLVGVNRFDKKGAKLGGEFQVYADKTDFVRVSLAAAADSIAMVYAEDRRGSGRVLTSRIQCRDLE